MFDPVLSRWSLTTGDLVTVSGTPSWEYLDLVSHSLVKYARSYEKGKVNEQDCTDLDERSS